MTLSGDPTWSQRLRGIGLWVALGCVLFLAFTFMQFPYEALHTRLAAELARQLGAAVAIDVKRPLRPFGIEWVGVRVSRGEQPLATIGRVTGTISWAEGLRGRPVVHVSLWMDPKATTTPLTATVRFADWGFQQVAALDGGAEKVDLAPIVGTPVRSGRAKLSFTFTSLQPSQVDGQVQADLTDLAADALQQQGLRTPEWSFATVRAKVVCAQLVCKVDEFSGNGQDGSISATGQILLGRTPDETRWDVAATVTVGQALSQRVVASGGFPLPAGVPVRVKLIGPLLRPQVSL